MTDLRKLARNQESERADKGVAENGSDDDRGWAVITRVLNRMIVILGFVAFVLCLVTWIDNGDPMQLFAMLSGFFVRNSMAEIGGGR